MVPPLAIAEIIGIIIGIATIVVGALSKENLGGRCGVAFEFFMAGVISILIGLVWMLLFDGLKIYTSQYAGIYPLFLVAAMVLFSFGAYVVSTIQKA